MALRLCGQKNIRLLISRRMKQLLSLLAFIFLLSSCSIERRHYLPGFHVEGYNVKGLGVSDEVRRAEGDGKSTTHSLLFSEVSDSTSNSVTASSTDDQWSVIQSNISSPATLPQHLIISTSSFVTSASSLTLDPSPLESDTLKKPYRPQQQYREVDPVGKWSVFVVLAAVVMQKIVAMLAWFEFIVPWTFGPGIFIPALIVALIGVGLQAYSAYRVRKYPEKYKKNEWGKAAIAILGWQILMSLLFAWLLGGLPIG